MTQQEPVEQCAEAEQEADGQQQAAHADDYDEGSKVRELEVLACHSVVADLGRKVVGKEVLYPLCELRMRGRRFLALKIVDDDGAIQKDVCLIIISP